MTFTNASAATNGCPYYGGGQVNNPANVIFVTSNPGAGPTSQPLGTIAIRRSTGSIFQLANKTSSSATWVALGGGSTDVNTLTPDSGTSPVTPTGGTITLAGGTGVSTVGTANTVTFNVVGGGLKTTVVAGTSQAAAINNRYVPNNVALCTVTLPAVAAVGSMVIVDGLGSGGWLIAQNAGQLISSSGGTTTTGVGGSLASTNRYDSVTLVNVVANTTWKIEGMVGTITIV